ncbi:MAG: site-specific integrase [Acidobacteriota bacterium]|nr:site-specific integrase [Acidobacteriota bacterium]
MFLERDQIADLLRAVRGQPEENAIIHCGLLLGLRRGEILGLKWSDVDTEERRVHVRRSVRKRYVGLPKTKNSRRAVDAPDAALRALAAYRESRPGENGDFIFRRDDGMRLHPETWYKRVFPKIRERAGLPSTFKMHSLRHTYASLLIFQGENIKYVSRQLGHGSIAITGDTYAHILSENTTSAMKKLDAAIGDIRRDMIRVVG